MSGYWVVGIHINFQQYMNQSVRVLYIVFSVEIKPKSQTIIYGMYCNQINVCIATNTVRSELHLANVRRCMYTVTNMYRQSAWKSATIIQSSQ